MIAQNSEVYNPPTYLFHYTRIWKKISVGGGVYTSLFCAIIPALFPYFLPFWYPYILLHFQMFFITCNYMHSHRYTHIHKYTCMHTLMYTGNRLYVCIPMYVYMAMHAFRECGHFRPYMVSGLIIIYWYTLYINYYQPATLMQRTACLHMHAHVRAAISSELQQFLTESGNFPKFMEWAITIIHPPPTCIHGSSVQRQYRDNYIPATRPRAADKRTTT